MAGAFLLTPFSDHLSGEVSRRLPLQAGLVLTPCRASRPCASSPLGPSAWPPAVSLPWSASHLTVRLPGLGPPGFVHHSPALEWPSAPCDRPSSPATFQPGFLTCTDLTLPPCPGPQALCTQLCPALRVLQEMLSITKSCPR